MKQILVLQSVALFFFQSVTAQQTSWYKCLKGTIDKYSVTINLHKMENSYAGYYYYNARQEPVYFIGDDTTEKGKIKLIAFSKSGDDKVETFSIVNKDSIFTGAWQKDEKGNPLVFSAKVSKDKAIIPFRLIYHRGIKELRPGIPGSPAVSFDAATIWPVSENSTSEFIEKTIKESFGNEKFEGDPEHVFQELENQYFDEYIQGYKDVTDEELKDQPYSYSSQEINHVLVVYQTKKILSVSNFTYSYTGGAHGNYSTGYITLDLVNRKELHLDEIIGETGEKQLPRLLEKYFRKAYNVPAVSKLTDAGLFENKIENNENFCVTGKGLFFSYAPYEIGPYAMGEITIFIPFSELQNYLKPKFRALLQ